MDESDESQFGRYITDKGGMLQKSKIIYHKEHKGNSPSTQMIETNLLIICVLRVKLCELGGKMDFWDSTIQRISNWAASFLAVTCTADTLILISLQLYCEQLAKTKH